MTKASQTRTDGHIALPGHCLQHRDEIGDVWKDGFICPICEKEIVKSPMMRYVGDWCHRTCVEDFEAERENTCFVVNINEETGQWIHDAASQTTLTPEECLALLVEAAVKLIRNKY